AGADTAEVTDSDPFFAQLHPWIRPLALEGAPDAVPVAEALESFLRSSREVLVSHQVNRERQRRGLPPLDVLTTKWGGVRRPLPSFADRVGCSGAAVTSSALYRGLASLLGMTHVQPEANPDLGADIARRLELAVGLLDGQAAFVHVHSKAPDEAGHSKLPFAKRDVLEAIDTGLGPLVALSERAVVAVTGDHATPSSSGVLHSGDPTPFVVAGPTVRPDEQSTFGEETAARGAFGVLRAADLLPLLLGYANRPRFLGHRPTTHDALALADRPIPLRLDAKEAQNTPRQSENPQSLLP
ncbi:MAG: alkaline phosphatase family protein, partial [Acidimicrobiia bacterium]